MKRQNAGQSVAEYFIVLCVVLAAVLAVGFIDRIRGAFGTYFTTATDTITKVAN